MSQKSGMIGMTWVFGILFAWSAQAQDTDTTAVREGVDTSAATASAPATEGASSEEAVPQDGVSTPESAPEGEVVESVEPAPVEPAPVEPAPVEPAPAEIAPATGSGVAGSDAMVETVSVSPAPPPPGYDQMNLPPPPRKGLMIAGWGSFGGVYLITALAGLMMLSGDATESGEECVNCDKVGPRMLIPLVGPFMAIPDADGADGRAVCSVLGVLQIAGISLGIVGTVIYAKKKRTYREALLNAAYPRFNFAYDGRAGVATILWTF